MIAFRSLEQNLVTYFYGPFLVSILMLWHVILLTFNAAILNRLTSAVLAHCDIVHFCLAAWSTAHHHVVGLFVFVFGCAHRDRYIIYTSAATHCSKKRRCNELMNVVQGDIFPKKWTDIIGLLLSCANKFSQAWMNNASDFPVCPLAGEKRLQMVLPVRFARPPTKFSRTKSSTCACPSKTNLL